MLRLLPSHGMVTGVLPEAFGGQCTAAVSPAGVFFQMTSAKVSSPQISWGSVHRGIRGLSETAMAVAQLKELANVSTGLMWLVT